jgi:UDP-hydrolysing UDP-N-acetyl-D-glucosamine 2-epimerase
VTRRVAIVTGTRAEFGLLRSTIDAVAAHPDLECLVVAGGAHLLPPARTIDEVRRLLPAGATLVAEVPMQMPGRFGRDEDASALGRGVSGFAEVFAGLDPAAVVVLGDRIEALAAASAASIGGRRVVHLHGGDRAEGVADEAMRHAITALSHLHLAATEESGGRLRRMGEDPAAIHVVGSPAVDGLDVLGPLDDASFEALGSPRTVVLHHGAGLDVAVEAAWIDATLAAVLEHGPTLLLSPNADPGSDVVLDHIDRAAAASDAITRRNHLPREVFVGLLRRIDAILGNSSAGLIEAAIVGCPAVNLGPRQGGRERPASVIDIEHPDIAAITDAIRQAAAADRHVEHPYGTPGVGERIANHIARLDITRSPRKRLAY